MGPEVSTTQLLAAVVFGLTYLVLGVGALPSLFVNDTVCVLMTPLMLELTDYKAIVEMESWGLKLAGTI